MLPKKIPTFNNVKQRVFVCIYGLLNDAHNSYKKNRENDGNNKNQAQKILRYYIQLNSLSNRKSQFS